MITSMMNDIHQAQGKNEKGLPRTFDTKNKTKQEQCCFAIKQIWEFLESYIGIANTHGAEFISEQHWDKFVPHTAQDSLLNLNCDELVKLPLYHKLGLADNHDYEASQLQGEEHNPNPRLGPSNNNYDINREKNGGTLTNIKEQWLSSFTHQAYQCHLENLNILTSLSQFVRDEGYQNVTAFNSHIVVSEAMSEKKIHEVGIMSDAVVTIFKACQADVIVDIGSGKGYLGAEVSRKHVISVLGMDSSDSNTHGAIRRDAQLGKRWKGLVKRKDKQSSQSKEQAYCDDDDPKLSNNGDYQQHAVTKVEGANVGLYKPDQAAEPSPNLYVPITKFVHPEMNLRRVIQQHASHLLTGSEANLLLTGLHTCGSLAVTMMRLFVQDPDAVGLCCVGCCYQLMEELDKNCSVQTSDDTVNCHFPLSDYGKQLELYLGRNARNLASQSVHRMQASGQLQGGDFYWRALLDIVIKKLGLSVPGKIKGMRGLHKKCKTFKEYVETALKKLGLSPDLISGEMLKETEELYESTKAQMVAFFQLKLVLTPLIEALILLDRLLFLLQQEAVCSASLVPLFDPVTSPRCYALIAVKNKTSNAPHQT